MNQRKEWKRALSALGAGKRKPNPETLILRDVREYLRWHGWTVKRFQQGLGSERGIPDLCAFRAGVFVFIEVKTENGRLSDDQRRFRDECEAEAIPHLVIRSLDEAAMLDNCYPRREGK